VLQPVPADAYSQHLARAGSPLVAWQRVVWDVWGLSLGETAPWRARVAGISALITHLPAVQAELGQELDATRIGAGGYSYGAQAALYLGGARFCRRGRRTSWRHERIGAVLAISPEGGGRRQPRGVWHSLTTPFFLLTGEHDADVRGRGVSAKRAAFTHAFAKQKYISELRGANHFALSGRLAQAAVHPADKRAQEAIFDHVKAQTLVFWTAYLQKGAPAQAARRLLDEGFG
jgi:predicted dienelactone hydrolase